MSERYPLLIIVTTLLCTYHKVVTAWYLDDQNWTFLTTWDDDTNYIINSNFKQPLLSFLLSGDAFMSLINVWEPASWLLKCIVWNVTNGSDKAFRMCGFLLHSATSIILHLVLQRILRYHRNRDHSKEDGRIDHSKEDGRIETAALLGAIWYAVHPLNVDVVCWPSALPYSLAGLFQVSALYMYTLTTAYDPLDHVHDRSICKSLKTGLFRMFDWYYCGAVVLTILSICSKSAALLAAPAGFLAIDMLRYHTELPSFFQSPLRWLSYAVRSHICVGASVIMLLGITVWANISGMESDIDITTVNHQQRLIKAPMLLIKCLCDSIFPTQLRPHYMLQFSMLNLFHSPLCIMSFALLPLCWLCLRVIFKGNAGGVWMSVTLLPVLGLIQHGYVCFGADRLWKFALVPLASAYAILFVDVSTMPTIPTIHIKIVAVSILCGLATIASLQTEYWQNDESLWMANLHVDRTDWRASDQLVEHYIGNEKWEAARPHLLSIQMFSPSGGLKAELHKAKLLLMQGLTEDACSIYKDLSNSRSFLTSPARGAIFNNVAVCCLHRSDVDCALHWFEHGMESTSHQRHRKTLTQNHDELLRVLKEDPMRAKGYVGKHSLIF
jgi:hypothetical protein